MQMRDKPFCRIFAIFPSFFVEANGKVVETINLNNKKAQIARIWAFLL
jgi:hypothetical protein